MCGCGFGIFSLQSLLKGTEELAQTCRSTRLAHPFHSGWEAPLSTSGLCKTDQKFQNNLGLFSGYSNLSDPKDRAAKSTTTLCFASLHHHNADASSFISLQSTLLPVRHDATWLRNSLHISWNRQAIFHLPFSDGALTSSWRWLLGWWPWTAKLSTSNVLRILSKGTSQNRKISGTKNAKSQFCKMNHMKLILVDSMYLQPLTQGMARAMCQAVALKDFWTDRIRRCCSGHEDPTEMS